MGKDYIRWFIELAKKRNSKYKRKCQWIRLGGYLSWQKKYSYREALELVASMATTRSANGNLIDDELHLFEKVECEAVYILKLKKIRKGSSLYSQINITKKRDAYKTGADQHLAILMSSEWRSY